MAKKFREAVQHGEATGLHPDELLFYDALADNTSAVQVLGDEILKKIAAEGVIDVVLRQAQALGEA